MNWQVPEPLATAHVRLADGRTSLLRRHGNANGPRLVISHANGLSSDAYLPFWSLLVDRFDIVLYDLRGHGVNPPGELVDHNAGMMAQDNRRIVRAIDQYFGEKPQVGVFHSVSAAAAVLHAIEEDAYEALGAVRPGHLSESVLPESSRRAEAARDGAADGRASAASAAGVCKLEGTGASIPAFKSV